MALRILIVDDHAVVRQAIQGLISAQTQWLVCGEAADGIDAVDKARELRPDVILMDISMPRMDGLQATRIIRLEIPASRVITVSQNDPPPPISGYAPDAHVSKAHLARDLVPTIRRLCSGDQTEQSPSLEENDRHLRQVLDALPAAIYTTDTRGQVTYFNPAAVEFSGRTPELGTDKWCVSWKILTADGTPVPPDECPMAISLKEERTIQGGEFQAERPDGSRIWFTPYPRLLRDQEGRLIGGVNMLVDVTDRKRAERELHRVNSLRDRARGLVEAIVESSDDAIVSKDLSGVITSWNRGAERIFGYSAQEAIGRHITLIIPPDRYKEEERIIQKLKRGERIEHFETVRVRKDGTLADISLAISPVKDSDGNVMGASKVARDITEQKRIERALAAGAAQHRAMFQLADQLHRATSLEEMYTAVLDAITGALGCERASVLIYDAQRVMRFVSWRGLSDAYRKATEGHSPWKSDQPEPEPICMADVGRLSESLKAVVRLEGIGALAFIPLVSHGRLIGKFMTYFNEPHAFTEDEIDVSLTIARQLAFGMERLKAEEGLRDSEEQFRRLAETLDAEVRARTQELEQRNADVLRQSEHLRELWQRLMQSQDEERRRVARELHDSAGQTLAVLSMQLTQLTQAIQEQAPSLAGSAQGTQDLTQQLNQEIRTMSYLLHPPLLDESGLAAALSWYVQGLAERSVLKIDLEIAADIGRLPRDMELVVFRLVQECLTNIHRHAESKRAAIKLERDAECVYLEVRDQGKGMSPERLAQVQVQGFGVGIRGMRERVRQFGGEMKIESGPSGTAVSFIFPAPVAVSDVKQDTGAQIAAPGSDFEDSVNPRGLAALQ